MWTVARLAPGRGETCELEKLKAAFRRPLQLPRISGRQDFSRCIPAAAKVATTDHLRKWRDKFAGFPGLSEASSLTPSPWIASNSSELILIRTQWRDFYAELLAPEQIRQAYSSSTLVVTPIAPCCLRLYSSDSSSIQNESVSRLPMLNTAVIIEISTISASVNKRRISAHVASSRLAVLSVIASAHARTAFSLSLNNGLLR